MTPVFSEQFKLWVHPGKSGVWDVCVADELAAINYYHHVKIHREKPVIVDIGGHVGCYSRWAAETYPKGRVIYVEPHEENVALAKKNLAGLTNVTFLHAACTYEAGAVFWPHVSGSNSGGSQVLAAGTKPFENDCEHWRDARPLRTVTLEEIIERHQIDFVDVLKLDCEGSEFSILENFRCLDRVYRIQGEWHQSPARPSFRDFAMRYLGRQFAIELHTPTANSLGMFTLTNLGMQLAETYR